MDPNGLVTPTNQRRTILIHILSIRNPPPSTNKTDPEKSMTSYKPDYQHAHHRKHFPNNPATSAHRGMLIQRDGTLFRHISMSIRRNGMSKEATIAIIMKLLLVSWDLWTYRIGFKLITKNLPPIYGIGKCTFYSFTKNCMKLRRNQRSPQHSPFWKGCCLSSNGSILFPIPSWTMIFLF